MRAYYLVSPKGKGQPEWSSYVKLKYVMNGLQRNGNPIKTGRHAGEVHTQGSATLFNAAFRVRKGGRRFKAPNGEDCVCDGKVLMVRDVKGLKTTDMACVCKEEEGERGEGEGAPVAGALVACAAAGNGAVGKRIVVTYEMVTSMGRGRGVKRKMERVDYAGKVIREHPTKGYLVTFDADQGEPRPPAYWVNEREGDE